MLHNEARKLLIKDYLRTHDAYEVARNFSVNHTTVYRLVKRYEQEGNVNTRTYLRGRKHSLSEDDLQKIKSLVDQQPDITLHEITSESQWRNCSKSADSSWLHPEEKVDSRFRTGSSPMYSGNAPSGETLYLASIQSI